MLWTFTYTKAFSFILLLLSIFRDIIHGLVLRLQKSFILLPNQN